jgi:hypothetical protein
MIRWNLCRTAFDRRISIVHIRQHRRAFTSLAEPQITHVLIGPSVHPARESSAVPARPLQCRRTVTSSYPEEASMTMYRPHSELAILRGSLDLALRRLHPDELEPRPLLLDSLRPTPPVDLRLQRQQQPRTQGNSPQPLQATRLSTDTAQA